MKTRNELQKEVEVLQKTLTDTLNSTYKLNGMNDTLLAENKRLESEIERNDGAIVRQSLRLEEMNNQLVKFWELESQNKQLQTELEVANNHVQHLQNQMFGMVKQIHEYRDENICMRHDIREVKRKESELKDELRQLESKTLFQLIRWWWNAKD